MNYAASPRIVWLIRHAESEWNALGRWQGQRDSALSERGREQAQRLAATLAAAQLEAIIASDLARARETAAIVGTALGVPLHLDARLRERDLGYWSGLTSVEIVARWPGDLARLRARDPALEPGGGESLRALHARVVEFVTVLAAWPGEGPLAVVTHAGVLRALGIAPTPGNAAVRSATIGALWQALATGAATQPASRSTVTDEEERL
jgi:2,3-bisphosphoglycerate-dependent phosphoglycerate mutase